MKPRYCFRYILAMVTTLSLTSLLVLTSALAGPNPVPITADQAFDAVMTGIDPTTGVTYGAGKVAIVDVRTPPEYQFIGTAGKVDSILMKEAATPLVPDMGKVKLTREGGYLEYTLAGKHQKTAMDEVAKLETSPIAVNIPCATWNEQTKKMDPAPDHFINGIERLAEEGV